MNRSANPHKRHRFAPAIIQNAVWLDHRFNLSQRNIEDLLVERGDQDGAELFHRRPGLGRAFEC
jgi:transposase-like protein